jgi:activator of 2-hydroxyglutaryl-CoA dehydratase
MEEQISKQKFASLMAQLRASFTRAEMTADQVAVYFAFLKHIPEAELERAVHHMIATRTSPIFPTVAEIKTEAEGRTRIEIKVGAMEAWNKARVMLVAGADYRTDPIINSAVRMAFGGWARLEMDEQDGDFTRNRFSEAYQAIVSDDRRMDEIKRLGEAKKTIASLTE